MSFLLNNRNQYFIIIDVVDYSIVGCYMSRINNIISSFHGFWVSFTCARMQRQFW